MALMVRTLLSLACLMIVTMPTHGNTLSTAEGARRLIEHQIEQSEAYALVEHLADQIGPRPSGSDNAAEAVRWAASKLESWGLDVRLEPVTVPRWIRGEEWGTLPSHRDQTIVLTALGGSVATPGDGIVAEVIEVHSLEEIDRLGEAVRGKIVLYDVAMDMDMVRNGRSFQAYSAAVPARGAGADRAARYGAVAALVRSVGSTSLRTPHTGALRYQDEVPRIPAAAVTWEDADLIHRLLGKGQKVTMRLVLTPRMEEEVQSANVVAELRGRERPDEVVVIGGHLDSWDLGTGAIDNGAGVAGTMDALRAMAELGLTPRRTIRLVLFMNEEMGLSGARQYFADHEARLETHFATLESDAGATEPVGFISTVSAETLARLEPELAPLREIGATMFIPGSPSAGADTSPMAKAGVPGFGLIPNPRHYFDYHHTAADTLDKIVPEELRKNAAAVAGMAWILADTEIDSLR